MTTSGYRLKSGHQLITTMDLGIVGTGRMGQTVIRLAEQNGHRIVACCNSKQTANISLNELSACDVVIDFSIPSSALEHIELYVENGITAVMGTTGWYENLHYVEKIVETKSASLLYASNFSTGIAILQRMLRSLDFQVFTQFDLEIEEVHHANKVDAPSGTALDLAETIGLSSSRISSHRIGDIKGRHQIAIRSKDESVHLSHEVLDRAVFALGALRAAEWLIGRTGLFTFDDVFEERRKESLLDSNTI